MRFSCAFRYAVRDWLPKCIGITVLPQGLVAQLSPRAHEQCSLNPHGHGIQWGLCGRIPFSLWSTALSRTVWAWCPDHLLFVLVGLTHTCTPTAWEWNHFNIQKNLGRESEGRSTVGLLVREMREGPCSDWLDQMVPLFLSSYLTQDVNMLSWFACYAERAQ